MDGCLACPVILSAGPYITLTLLQGQFNRLIVDPEHILHSDISTNRKLIPFTTTMKRETSKKETYPLIIGT